ncbi:MAG: hypothetical protein LBR89_01715 [Holosporales bacterium]|jgi:hypothetical protein|nr:hypothetical protein [Holosporales bacterium]
MIAVSFVRRLTLIILMFGLHAFGFDAFFTEKSRLVESEYSQNKTEFLNKYKSTCESKIPRHAANQLIATYKSHYAALVALCMVVRELKSLPSVSEQLRHARAISLDIMLRSRTVSVDAASSYITLPGVVDEILIEPQPTTSAQSTALKDLFQSAARGDANRIVEALDKTKIRLLIDDILPVVPAPKSPDRNETISSYSVKKVANYFEQNPFDDEVAEYMAVYIIKLFSSRLIKYASSDIIPLVCDLNDQVQMASSLSDIGEIEIQNDAQYTAFWPIIYMANALLDIAKHFKNRANLLFHLQYI